MSADLAPKKERLAKKQEIADVEEVSENVEDRAAGTEADGGTDV